MRETPISVALCRVLKPDSACCDAEHVDDVIQHTADVVRPHYSDVVALEGFQMAETLWVRLCEDVDCGLRRGAWYEAISVGQTEVVLWLEARKKSFPRQLFETSDSGPTHWTVVSHAGNSTQIPARWTKGYAVCPSCSWRQLLYGQPRTMLCEGCYQEFTVDWDEPYLKAG